MVGTAIATELGNMSVNREVAALRLVGIPVNRFVIMPRMAGMILSMICLTLYFDVVAILSGYLVATVQLTVPFYAFADRIIHALSFTDVLLTALKGIVFGATVASVCCHHGLSVRSSFTEVHQQTTKAETSATLYERAMALARDRRALAILLNNAGLLHQRKGESEAARQAYREASVINGELGHREAEASNHANLGCWRRDNRILNWRRRNSLARWSWTKKSRIGAASRQTWRIWAVTPYARLYGSSVPQLCRTGR